MLLLSILSASAVEPRADLVVRGPIWTLDPDRPAAEALAVADGVVVSVGPWDEVAGWVGEGTEVMTLSSGQIVLPGFVDAHVHPAEAGVELGQCDLTEAEDAASALAAVGACHRADPGEGWLVGAGWDLTLFPPSGPSAADLEAVAPGRPVFLQSADGHSAWVSVEALRRAKVDADTPDPPAGRIERDAAGAPTGTLREDAVDLVASRVPARSGRVWRDGIRRAMRVAAEHGVTTLFEARASEAGKLRAYRALDRRGELTSRVVVALEVEPDGGTGQVDRLVRWRRRFAGDRLHPVAAKLFLDGVIEARTAAMLAPYDDVPGAGEPLWTQPALDAVVARLVAEGFSVHFHAIGDRAVRMALDAAEAAGPGRFAAAHLQVIDPADVPRFATLGVAPVFQPLWAQADAYIRDLTWPGIGPERSAALYPIGAVAAAGAELAFGSDWSVSSIAPLEGIEVAVTRIDADAVGDGEAPLCPDQAISAAEAVAAYTRGSGRAVPLDGVGVLRVGAPADLVVLDADPREVAPAALGDIGVVLTLAGGRRVWGSGP